MIQKHLVRHSLLASISLSLLTPSGLSAGELFQIGGIRPIAEPIVRPADEDTILRIALPTDPRRTPGPAIANFGRATDPDSGQAFVGIDVELPPGSLARLQSNTGTGWRDVGEERFSTDGLLQFRAPASDPTMLFRVATRPAPIEASRDAEGFQFRIMEPVSTSALAQYLMAFGIEAHDGDLSSRPDAVIEPTREFQSLSQLGASADTVFSNEGMTVGIHEDKPLRTIPVLQVFDESIPGLVGSRSLTIFDTPQVVFGYTLGAPATADRVRWKVFDERMNLVKSGSTNPGWLNLFSIDFSQLVAGTPNTPRDFTVVMHEEANGESLGESNAVHVGLNRLPFGQEGELRIHFDELICHMTTSGAGRDDTVVDVFRIDLGDPTFHKVEHVVEKDRSMGVHEVLEIDTSISARSQSSGSHFGDVVMMIVAREQDGFSADLDTPQMEHTLGAVTQVSQNLPNRLEQIMANLRSHIHGIADNDGDEIIGIRFIGVSKSRVQHLANTGLAPFEKFMDGDDSTYEARLQLIFDPQ